MPFLDDVIKVKEKEIAGLKLDFIKKFLNNVQPSRDFLFALPKGKLSLIAEIKKASPSAGVIREDFDFTALGRAYEGAGAAAISVLTENQYFQGSMNQLWKVKSVVSLPILRKDFIIDEKQIYESRTGGADALLLIVKLLDESKLGSFIKLTEELGMQSVVEVHEDKEMEMVLNSKAKIIGINNRDLNTLKLDIETTPKLIDKFPEAKERMLVSESGISSAKDVKLLKPYVDAILVGESLLKAPDIKQKISELLNV